MKHVESRGFTLIELLIVVAIIAVLAAIAVPNFLEAQTRAKVARVNADLRAVGIALESYAIDWSNYPHDQELVEKITGNTNMEFGRRWAYQQLSTPVAYVSGYSFDVFQDKRKPVEESKDRNVYPIRNIKYLGKVHPKNYWGIAARKGYLWVNKSNGPMQLPGGTIPEAILAGYDNSIYDPSNGSISQGIIVYSNKGVARGVRE